LVKPLLDGKKICDLYGIKQGKAIGKIMDEEMQYQIVHPAATHDEVAEYLKGRQEEFLAKYN
jgi:hypothetical protein